VPEAGSYIVEVCRDAGCGAVVERAVGVAGLEWRPAALPVAALWWRVTARSRSGLDGYPGAARQLAVTAATADTQAPAGALALAGPQVRVGETLWAGPEAHLEMTPADAAEGGGDLALWRPVINGREGELAAAAGPWAAGTYEIGAVAMDRCGNRGPVAPVVFTVDATPPTLTWEVLPWDRFEGRGARARKAKPGRLAWSGGAQWLPLPGDEEIRIASDAPQAFFHAPGARFKADGREILLGDGDMLRVRAEDGASRVDHLRFRLRPAAGGAMALELETGDLVGNSREVGWEVRLP
jgi:hypothetical protein